MNNILLLVKIEYKINVEILKEMIKILFNLDLGKKKSLIFIVYLLKYQFVMMLK